MIFTLLCPSHTFFKVKVQGQNDEMLAAACQQFLGKKNKEIVDIAKETLEGHQRAIMGNMTVEVSPTTSVLASSFVTSHTS